MDLIKSKLDRSFKDNVLSGITVALALVPEAIAFSFIAGIDPVLGLTSAFIIALVSALAGGRPGMISGATGAIAVVVAGLVSSHGVGYMILAVILMGVIQVLCGLLKLGKLVRMIPHPVMIGFVNGLAIVIFLAQLEHFKEGGVWLGLTPLAIMGALIVFTMAIIKLFPKLTKSIPATLVAIGASTILVQVFNIDTRTVGDLADISGSLPQLASFIVPLNLETLKVILPYSAMMAIVGLAESLMTLTLIDDITNTKGDANRECVGQGLANIVCGMFGGMGGCAMIGQSMLNIKSNGTGRLSGVIAALGLISIVLFGAPLIALIPVGALVGIMFVVVIATFDWSTLTKLNRIQRSDALVIIVVTTVTILTNLAIAVVSGIVLSALVFAWEKGKKIESSTHDQSDNLKVYELRGPLFFASIKSFNELFDPLNDPDRIVIDFASSKVYDHSAVAALEQLLQKYSSLDKTVILKNLSGDCVTMLEKAKFDLDMAG